MSLWALTILLLSPGSLPSANAFMPGFYCGKENCYEVLGVTRDSSRNEIAKSYRKLAGKYHPDRVREKEDEAEALDKFRLVATAYETLKDDDTRADYDYLLDHPDEFLRNYYNYYRRRVAPKVDVRIVILVTVLLISVFQYASACHKYNEAIAYLLSQPKYKLQAVEIAKTRGLLGNSSKKGKRKRDKDEIREEETAIIRAIVEENADIKGGYKKPSVLNTLAVQIIFLPYYLFTYISWWLRWMWKFVIQRQEYGEIEKLYLIRKNMKISQAQFDTINDAEIDQMLHDELWITENFDKWKKNREEEEKRKLAESGRYKQYRRYMKKGASQISFVDED